MYYALLNYVLKERQKLFRDEKYLKEKDYSKLNINLFKKGDFFRK